MAKTLEPWARKVNLPYMLHLIKFTLTLYALSIFYILFALRHISAYKARCLACTVPHTALLKGPYVSYEDSHISNSVLTLS